MKKLLTILVLLTFTLSTYAQESNVNWVNFEQAQAKNKNTPKLFLIKIYADWCGWCKALDKSFEDKSVSEIVNTSYYPIKFNSEKDLKIDFFGKSYGSLPTKRGKQVSELAARLTRGKLSYPSMVFIDSKGKPLALVQGYKKPEELKRIVELVVEKTSTAD